MAEHNLFFGGNGVQRYPLAMLPSRDVEPDQYFQADGRRGPVLFSLTRRLTWQGSNSKCGCADGGMGSDALYHYLDETPIEQDDIINTHIMPRQSSLERVWIDVVEPLAGFTFDLSIRGNAASLGGTPSVPAPVVVASGIDGGVEGSQLIVLPDPVYFDQNDMLQMTITALPPEGIKCSTVDISPVVMEYSRGNN